MSKNLNEQILSIVNNTQQVDESFASAAKEAANSVAGRVVAAALLANPVGGVQTNPGSRPSSIQVPQGSVETVVPRKVYQPDAITTKTVPTTNFVSTRPEAAIPATEQQTTISHGTFEFTGQAHPVHGTPVMKDGSIKPGSDTFRVNTATGETHKLNPNSSWTRVGHSQYVAPTRDQIESRAVPGSTTHNAIQAAKAQDTVTPATQGAPAIASKLKAVPGSKEVTSRVVVDPKTVLDTVSVPAHSISMHIPGSSPTSSLVPRSDEYLDTSKPVGVERRREMQSTPPEKTTVSPVISNDLPANTDERLNRKRETGETETAIPSTPTPPAARFRSDEPGRVRVEQGRRMIAKIIGGVPVYSSPKEGNLLPREVRVIRSHYEHPTDNMISEVKIDLKESYKEKLYNLLSQKF
jgi:hypothetical protein